MADFKDERAYDSQKLTQVFLWSSLALLVCVAWMAWKDYDRDWKHYQRMFNAMERQRTREKYGQATGSIDKAQYSQLKSDLKSAEQELKSHKSQIHKLEARQDKLDSDIFKTNSAHQITKANIDADKFAYGEGLKNGKDDHGLKKKLDKEIDRDAALIQKLFEINQDKNQAIKDLAEIYAKRDATEASIKKMTASRDLLKAKYQSLKPPFSLANLGPYILFHIRNAPLLDFMAPTIQIQQVVLKNLPEDLYFARTMRVDRCMTCHVAIDKKGYEDARQPFRTHPHLETFLGPTSPHPMDKIGCTICHGGMGQAINFNGCAHVPNDEEEAARWKKSRMLNWKEPEAVQSQMLPLKYTEGSCLKCHSLQQHVNLAPKLNRGRELMVTRGCVGCHKVKNLEGLPKAGPSLLKVKGKLKKEFVEKWVWSPKSYNPHAKMPSFFQQTNNSDDEGLAKTKAELHAVVDFLYARSADYSPDQAPAGGSLSRGKKLFHDVGCAACHGIDDITAFHADFAPDLSTVGSKLTAPFVYTWIKNPRHFNPDTRMPSLRLSDQEASDITAYLMSKRNKDFEQLTPPEADPAVRDGLIVDYLKPQEGLEGAKTKMAGMDEEQKQMFLGEKTLNRYGCFGCHTIQGFETAQGIGTELTTWGSKRVSQIDFGFTEIKEIPHSHEGFLNAKLQNPRQFDKDKVVSFFDRLKMPNFYLESDDREAVITAVLGLTQTYVPDEMTAGIHGAGPQLEKGRRVVEKFNCRGCHILEGSNGLAGQGGRIRALFKAEGRENYAPPILNKIGARDQLGFLHDFLLGPHQIRRNLDIRMPSFHWSDEDLSAVLTYMNLKEDQVFPFKTIETRHLTGNDYTEARQLFEKLQCKKCHMVEGRPPVDPTSIAPELANVKHRLKPDWIVEWLGNPDAMMPGTPMPPFWPDGAAADPKLFGGDGLKQREAIRDYLYMLGTASEE